MTTQSRTYIELPSRERFDFLAIDPKTFDLYEIAESLSHICRFTGHTPGRLYSVAHHSLLVAELVTDEFKYEALMHDAHEAFVGDVATPLKNAIGDVAQEFGCRLNPYRYIEDRVAASLRALCGLPETLRRPVKAADNLAYDIEREFFYADTWHPNLDELIAMPVEVAGREWFLAVSKMMDERGVEP